MLHIIKRIPCNQICLNVVIGSQYIPSGSLLPILQKYNIHRENLQI